MAISRTNWLLAGSPPWRRCRPCGMLADRDGPARLNRIEPHACLKDVLARIHDHRIDRLDELLLMNWKPPV
ncbi:transposase domain-containing protein [Aromatoleum bremense]